MKQVFQNIRSGNIEIKDTLTPALTSGNVLIATHNSLISPGTERMLVEFSKANLIEKARMQPDKVKQVLEKMKTDGLMDTLKLVSKKMSEPVPLGYCNSGVVIDVGDKITDLKTGDRVASNGYHANVVSVPRNLVSKMPDEVTFQEGAFTVLGSIALQGVRLSNPTFGERYAVFGAGLVGLITIQFLKASGCDVFAVDINEKRLKMAEQFGAHCLNVNHELDPAKEIMTHTNGRGVDGAIITASAHDDMILHQAAQSCRKRGSIVLVGVVDLNLRRADFYEKELTFQVSCSYGPGRYDIRYEQDGLDYPEGFVRWTEGRNLEAVLSAIGSKKINVLPLVSHVFNINEASAGYDLIEKTKDSLGVIIKYPDILQNTTHSKKANTNINASKRSGNPVIAVIGTGNFANQTLLPCLKKNDSFLKYICGNTNGEKAIRLSRDYGAQFAITDYKTILQDEEVDTVFVLTRHDSHASLVKESLSCGKNVFVEKPLCVTNTELIEIENLYLSINESDRPHIMVGYNRRFSPHSLKIRELLKNSSDAINIVITINAGSVSDNHWTNQQSQGGRIIGEACHFVDLATYLVGTPPVASSAVMNNRNIQGSYSESATISLEYKNGSIATVNYFPNGSTKYPKETINIFYDGKVIVNNNFHTTLGYGIPKFKSFKSRHQDKGHENEISMFMNSVSKSGIPLIPFEELVSTSKITLEAVYGKSE